jgi:hypothetical protein
MEEEYKIHTFYILLILISIIIGLITVKWSDIPKLVEYMTFALSVTSLVVGILAISYGVYSTSTFFQSSSAISTASTEITANSTQLTRTTEELARKVGEIPSLLVGVKTRIDDTHLLLKDFITKPVPPNGYIHGYNQGQFRQPGPKIICCVWLILWPLCALCLFVIYGERQGLPPTGYR